MRDFRFESIWLLSHREKRARTITFHPEKNLILGRNHTGKSSLIRSLFETLGTTPQGTLADWDADAVSLVQFSIDGTSYYALRQRGNRGLYDSNSGLLIATGNHADWSHSFADITGFNLVLNDKGNLSLLADPACFFLPFYINQDGSWQASWSTFRGMQRFKSPYKAILDYFSGVRPPEYYQLQAERDQRQRDLADLQSELSSLERARARFGKSLSLTGPKVDAGNFRMEISRLTAEVSALNRRQEVLRDRAVREHELLAEVQLQINLATTALANYDNDMKFLRSESEERLICPTCGSEHVNSFLDLLSYAEDARVLRELVVRLHDDANEIKKRCRLTETALFSLEENYSRVCEVLDTRRGELQFRQVVDSMGAESAFRAFEMEWTELKREIDKQSGDIQVLDSRLRKLADRKRTEEITRRFRTSYSAARHALNLPAVDTSRLSLTSRPDLSGSGGPRSVLAYYAALWWISHGDTAAYSIPAVIDAPNQQGQDDVNLPIVLKFISHGLPGGMQLIVGSEKETADPFDKIIRLDEQYRILSDQEYSNVRTLVDPMLRTMFEGLMGQDQSSLFAH